ncbi:MAG: hypothetical protein K0S93_36 [Nitrososphaeraceae archaeon]|jgi:hypothetical protein|nr:hypothetical protein [Nitrososphaeraceae archaeon]
MNVFCSSCGYRIDEYTILNGNLICKNCFTSKNGNGE